MQSSQQTESIQRHYDNKPELHRHIRKERDLNQLFEFHNFIKVVCLKLVTPEAICADGGVLPLCVWDTCGGKAADFEKWIRGNPNLKLYVCTDISKNTISAAVQRCKKHKAMNHWNGMFHCEVFNSFTPLPKTDFGHPHYSMSYHVSLHSIMHLKNQVIFNNSLQTFQKNFTHKDVLLQPTWIGGRSYVYVIKLNLHI